MSDCRPYVDPSRFLSSPTSCALCLWPSFPICVVTSFTSLRRPLTTRPSSRHRGSFPALRNAKLGRRFNLFVALRRLFIAVDRISRPLDRASGSHMYQCATFDSDFCRDSQQKNQDVTLDKICAESLRF